MTHPPPRTAPPCFLITIDTEGDNLWSRPRTVTTRNAEYLERFQALCEECGLRPTWLTNHEMIASPTYRRFAEDVLARDVGEIGMHLHAWDSPPLVPLTDDDLATHPYLIEFPDAVMKEKIHALTATLEDALGVKMVSHRAGRWGFDERYAQLLVDEGYKVDCSVTPLISWQSSLGDPRGTGGPDYRRFPQHPYWLDLGDISRPGRSPLLEVPATVVSGRPAVVRALESLCAGMPRPLRPVGAFGGRVIRRLFPETLWLRPTGDNERTLLRVAGRAARGDYAELMFHSSELMPGGSPTFPTAASIERLYGDLRTLFEWVRSRFRGATLAEFYGEYAAACPPA